MKLIKYCLALLTMMLLTTNVYSQNRFFPNKYDCKPNVQITDHNNSYDRGILYAIEDDMIVIQSFSDMKLYAYQLDSVAKIKLRKGPGFLKVGTPVFIAFSSLLIGVDIFAIAIGTGIEMIPASAFIPFIAIPASVIAGTVSYIASTNNEYLINPDNIDEVKTQLNKYSIYDNFDTLRYTDGTFPENFKFDKKRNIRNKKIGVNIFFGLNTQVNTFRHSTISLLESLEYTNMETDRLSLIKNYHFGFSYDMNSKLNIGIEFYATPSKRIFTDIIEPNEPDGYLRFSAEEYTYGSKNLFLNYTVLGDNQKLHSSKLKVGLGLLINRRSFHYELAPDEFDVSFSLPYGNSSNYGDTEKFGIEISSSYFIPLKASSSLKVKAYTNLFPQVTFDAYEMTYLSDGSSINFSQQEMFIPEFGIKASLVFHL